nr:hypothetical protein [Tanacetum cinerariifolium]
MKITGCYTSPPVLPIEDPEVSLIMGNEELNTIPEKESHEFIKSSIKDLVPIPSESDDTSGNDKNIESKDSYDSNLDEPDLLVTPLFDVSEDKCFDPGGNFEKIDAFLDIDTSTDVKEGYHDSEGDIIYLESLLTNEAIPSPHSEVFLDHDSKSLKDESVIDDPKNMVKIFDLGIHD